MKGGVSESKIFDRENFMSNIRYTTNGLIVYRCKICGRRFSFAENLKDHMQISGHADYEEINVSNEPIYGSLVKLALVAGMLGTSVNLL